MIKVFNATDKNYATHGDLILQPSKAVVHKEDNGEFYLDLETPLNEKEYKNTTPEEGQTAEGTSFSINADLTKQYQVQTLKGQTSQSGTPTPTSPQPINITTGRQVVSVIGRNYFDNSKPYTYQTTNNYLETTIPTGKRITWTSSTGNTYQFLCYAVMDLTDYVGKTIRFKTDFSASGSNTGSYYIGLCNADGTNRNVKANANGTSGQTLSFVVPTLSGQQTYLCVALYVNLTGTLAQNDYVDFTNIMLTINDDNMTYEEHKGNDYEINLGKNLLPNNAESQTKNGLTITKNADGSIYITGTSTALTQIDIYGTNSSAGANFLSNGTYVLSGGINNNQKLSLRIAKTTGNVYVDVTNTPKTFTIDDTVIGLWFYINIANGQSVDGTFYPQLEKGSVATSYTPYKTPIYLGKIGTYQDYIFRNTQENPLYDSNLEEGQWYIHKEIGRVVLNGSETWWANGETTNYGQYAMNLTDKGFGVSNIISSHFITDLSNQKNCIAGRANNNVIAITIEKSIVNYNASTFKTWLSTNNVEVCYGLATPTNTLIEDEELINQLNSIELLEGLNNVSVSSANLSGILQLKYNFTTAYSNTIKYIDYLVPNNILVANTPQGDQAFRITNIEKTRRKIKLKANHVFYDTMNYLIADSYVVDKNCNDALDHLNNATSDVSPFTTISNITSINSYRCVRKSLYEAIQVVLERWGGHLVRNDWTLGIYDTIGQDNGVTIRYAKNLKDISATYDWNSVVTKLLPVGKDGLLLNETDPDASIYVESATQYDIPYTKTVSFDQNNIVEDNYKDEDGVLDEEAYKQALVDDLYSKAMEYITNNYLPKVNYKLAANVEKVSDVGDRVEVIDEKLGINLMTNIISFDYDCILERYTQIEFGNFTPTLSNLMTQISVHTEEQINASTQTLQVTLNQELTDATDKIWNALGNSYVIYEGDKILVVDTLPKENATNVIMINNGGIAFSNSGIDGTFSSAWTIDNVLNMEQINVINLTADLIKGGTLKLGSNLNQNGRLEVFDEANTLIAELNKDGLKMYGADGSYVLMNNQVGFSGYDRKDNKIYWVDKDVFHQKKSEVEEEITLVKKMRIIPITIRDGNNQIVNDGIGFVNVGGGV